MNLFQMKIDNKLKRAIDKKAGQYGVPASSLVRIVLVKTFLLEANDAFEPGNVFNADRDNRGRGIPIDNLIAAL